MSPPLDLSLVIPCHNEEKNLQPLVSAIHSALDSFGIEYEIMITFDASTDDSWRVLKELAGRDPDLRIQRWNLMAANQLRAGRGCKRRRANTPPRVTPIWRMTRRSCRRQAGQSKMRSGVAEGTPLPATSGS